MENLRTWWQSLAIREQQLVGFCGFFVLIGVLYWGIWSPISSAQEDAERNHKAALQTLNYVKKAANEIAGPELRYSLIGLGDSNYDNFCGAIKQFSEQLLELGAKPLTDTLEIDACETMEPEAEMEQWVKSWHQAVNSAITA